jgi:hypothetical protein
MLRQTLVVLCFAALLTGPAEAQKVTPEPVHVAAGTVLAFHLQTRMQTATENETDLLPKGTVMMIKVLDTIDSTVDHDGTEFRGVLVNPIVSGNEVIVHAESEVKGLFVLLRSKTHPDGFRYELLITGIKDGDKSLDLTASLNSSFVDQSAQSAATPETGKLESPRENAAAPRN